MTQEQEKVTFSALGYEDYASGEFASAWFIGNSEEIKKRKYGQNPFSEKYGAVWNWIGTNRDRIKGLNFEEAEELMIADGVITYDDI